MKINYIIVLYKIIAMQYRFISNNVIFNKMETKSVDTCKDLTRSIKYLYDEYSGVLRHGDYYYVRGFTGVGIVATKSMNHKDKQILVDCLRMEPFFENGDFKETDFFSSYWDSQERDFIVKNYTCYIEMLYTRGVKVIKKIIGFGYENIQNISKAVECLDFSIDEEIASLYKKYSCNFICCTNGQNFKKTIKLRNNLDSGVIIRLMHI